MYGRVYLTKIAMRPRLSRDREVYLSTHISPFSFLLDFSYASDVGRGDIADIMVSLE